MKLTVSSCILLSAVQFTCLFLCHADSEDIASGSGGVPIDITNLTTSEPTSTVPNLLVPFSSDVDQPPPSVSVYVIPQVSLSLSASLSVDTLPTTVFDLPTAVSQTTNIFPPPMMSHQLTAVVSPSSISLLPSPSPSSLVSYIISLTRVVVIAQQQLGSTLSFIRQSLAGLLNLQTTDILNVDILTQQEKTKRQSSKQISFSAIEFSVREVHSNSVEQLQSKVRSGEIVTITLSPTETVQLKDIMTSLKVQRVPEGRPSLSSGQVAGIVLGVLAGVALLMFTTILLTALLVFKASRSKESQEIANLRHTYGYQYESHAMSQWPPQSPLL